MFAVVKAMSALSHVSRMRRQRERAYPLLHGSPSLGRLARHLQKSLLF